MDTDNKKPEEEKITTGETSTLHDAGVDLSSVDSSNKEEEFIDIDSAPIIQQDEDLKKLGVEVTEKENKEDLSLLKEQMDKKASLENKAPVSSVFKDEQVGKKPEIEKTENPPKENKEEKLKDADVSDLENEFNQTVGVSTTASNKNSSLGDKISILESMLIKIKDKLGFKKKEVKDELENLKKVKEDIAEDIANIKELEESKDKIEQELGKIDTISQEMSNIEKEVEEELKS